MNLWQVLIESERDCVCQSCSPCLFERTRFSLWFLKKVLIFLECLLMKKTGMQVCFCFMSLWGRLSVNTAWAQRSFQIQTIQLCKHIPELNKKAAKHTSTDACVHMQLKMCTNCGQIHRPEEHRIPKTRSHTQAHREVWCAGQGCEKLLFEKTPHKANKSLTRQMLVPLCRAALPASPERGSRKQA